MAWERKIDEDGAEEWERVVPGERLYYLWSAEGREVYAAGETFDGVEWVLDFSVMKDGELISRRFVTTDALADYEARAWAESTAAAWVLGLDS